jgi:hypothetical protein
MVYNKKSDIFFEKDKIIMTDYNYVFEKDFDMPDSFSISCNEFIDTLKKLEDEWKEKYSEGDTCQEQSPA